MLHASGVAALQTAAGRAQMAGDVDLEPGGRARATLIGRGPEKPGPTSISGNFRWRLPNAASFQDGVLRVTGGYDLENKKGDTTVAFDYTFYKDRSASVHGVATFHPHSDKPSQAQAVLHGSTEEMLKKFINYFKKNQVTNQTFVSDNSMESEKIESNDQSELKDSASQPLSDMMDLVNVFISSAHLKRLSPKTSKTSAEPILLSLKKIIPQVLPVEYLILPIVLTTIRASILFRKASGIEKESEPRILWGFKVISKERFCERFSNVVMMQALSPLLFQAGEWVGRGTSLVFSAIVKDSVAEFLCSVYFGWAGTHVLVKVVYTSTMWGFGFYLAVYFLRKYERMVMITFGITRKLKNLGFNKSLNKKLEDKIPGNSKNQELREGKSSP